MATADAETSGFLPIFMGSREEVESGDVDSILGSLQSLLKRDRCIEHRQGIMFGVTGYDDDPRELFEIPEVKGWIRRVDEKWPYWFFFMRTEPPTTLALIAFALCEYDVVPGGKQIRPLSLERFMAEKFMQMNGICEWLGDSEDTIADMTNKISGFFESGKA